VKHSTPAWREYDSVFDRIKNLLPPRKATLPRALNFGSVPSTDDVVGGGGGGGVGGGGGGGGGGGQVRVGGATIRASCDVEFSLMLTIALVVMAIFLFLRNLRAKIIPSVGVPLSLVGTLA